MLRYQGLLYLKNIVIIESSNNVHKPGRPITEYIPES